MTTTKSKLFLILGLLSLLACSKKNSDSAVTSTTMASTAPKYLYVAAGICYSGNGNTTFNTTTSSNLVYRINTSTRAYDTLVADFNAPPANSGDSPVAIADIDSSNMYILIENTTTGRRIEKAKKSYKGDRSMFSNNSTVLSAALRFMTKLSDGSLLISKTTQVEKMTASTARIGSPFITSNLGATCGTQANVTGILAVNNGKVIISNASAGVSRISMISATGWAAAGDCLAIQNSPSATGYPVAMAYVAASNQLIVAYGGNAMTTDLNSIYVYDINESTNTFTNATKIYDSANSGTYGYLMYGISAMTYDSADNSLYIATAISNATTVVNYNIEKFTYDPTGKTLTRVSSGGNPFYVYGVDTKCISSMFVGN